MPTSEPKVPKKDKSPDEIRKDEEHRKAEHVHHEHHRHDHAIEPAPTGVPHLDPGTIQI